MQSTQINTPKCICNQIVNPESAPETVIRCINSICRGLYHKVCLKMSNSEQIPSFECPSCILSKCDPLHPVVKILVPPFVVDNQRREFMIDKILMNEIQAHESVGIEIRSIKLEDKSHEQCWPSYGELILNQARCMEFRPLQQNSSLKKRKDEKYFTRQVKLGANFFYLKFIKMDARSFKSDETCIAAVYLVRKLSCQDLVQKIKKYNKRSLQDCKKIVAYNFQNSSLDIDKLSYPLTCVFDMQLLKTPAKGVHCKHINCFSLENFVSVWQKNTQRTWRCPICKLKAYDIVVDSYFEKIMSDLQAGSYKDPTQLNVEIYRDGTYKFLQDESGSESEDKEKPPVRQEKKAAEKAPAVVVLDESDEEAPPNLAAQKNTDNLTNVVAQPIKSPININEDSAMQVEEEGFFPISSQPTQPQVVENRNQGLPNNDIFNPATILDVIEDRPINETQSKKPENSNQQPKPNDGQLPYAQQNQNQPQQIAYPTIPPLRIQMGQPYTFMPWSVPFYTQAPPPANANVFQSIFPYNVGHITTLPVGPPGYIIPNNTSQSIPSSNSTLSQIESRVNKKPQPVQRSKLLQQFNSHLDKHDELSNKIGQLLRSSETFNQKINNFTNGLIDRNPTEIDSNKKNLTVPEKSGLSPINSSGPIQQKKFASKELKEATERKIQRLTEWSEMKIVLPNFNNYKVKRLTKTEDGKESLFQRSQKLISLAMKQAPIETRVSSKEIRPEEPRTETREEVPREKPSTSLPQTLLESRPDMRPPQLYPIPQLRLQPKTNNPAIGNAADPICLD